MVENREVFSNSNRVMCRLEEMTELGSTWCREGEPLTDGLAVLLSGRLAVRSTGCLLHKIEENQFLQSIEWSARKQESQLDLHQVEIAVEEAPCSILHLNPYWLEQISETRPDLKLILECVIGKDISLKLYMMNKMIGDTDVSMKKSKAPEPRMWKKSSSMDAINTGWRGIVRSHFWSDQGRGELAVTQFNPDLDDPRDQTNKTDCSHKLQWPKNINKMD